MKRAHKKQKNQENKEKVFISKKNGIKIKSTQLINSRVKTKRIARNIEDPKLPEKKEIKKIKEKQGPVIPKIYGNIFYFNNEYIENFVCTSFSIIIYLKQQSQKGEYL